MRISDDISNKKIDKLILLLTKEEILQLEDYLKQFINKSKNDGLHFHLSSEDYRKEITVCIYNPDNIKALHHRAQMLIRNDE